MKRVLLAIIATATGCFFAAAARASTTSNPLVYSDPVASATSGSAAAPVAATPAPAAAAPTTSGSGSCNSGCGSGCGCDSCCDGDGCCRWKLPHLLSCDFKLQPLLCWPDSCPLTCDDAATKHLFDNCCLLKEHDTTLTGWIDGGIMANSFNPATHFNGPVTFSDMDNGQVNQVYGVLQRTPADLSKNCGWYIGGDVDFFWGSDSFFTTAAGLDGSVHGNSPTWNTDPLDRYGFSMPQMYLETDYDDLRIKWGHFYTIIGYETVPAISNFFITHSYTMQYGEPFTHTGMLASRNINEHWSWSAGLVAGWNDFTLQDGGQFLGGITYTDKDYGSLAFSIVSGNESDFNVPGIGPTSNRTMYSLVWTRNLNSRWTYVMQHDLGVQQNTLGFNALDTKQAEWYGINQYLFYKLNCCWTLGGRFEWFDDPEGYLVTGLRPGNTDARYRFPGNFYEASLGLDYKRSGNLTIRSEVRYDWYSGQAGFFAPAAPGVPPNQPFGDNVYTKQFLFGVDAIYQF